MEQNGQKKPKQRENKNKVRIVVKPIYVGDKDMTEVFEKIAYDNIKNEMKTG